MDLRTYLLSDYNIEIMLCLVDVRTHRYDTTHACRILFAWSCTRCMHDTKLRISQKVRRATETVEHPRTHDASTVCVGVNVHLDWRVHTDHSQTADDLWRVRHLLWPQEQLASIVLPAIVESLEAVGRESDRCGSCEIEMTAVEEVQEGVLEDLSPYFEVIEIIAMCQPSNDGFGDVSDARLDR